MHKVSLIDDPLMVNESWLSTESFLTITISMGSSPLWILWCLMSGAFWVQDSHYTHVYSSSGALGGWTFGSRLLCIQGSWAFSLEWVLWYTTKFSFCIHTFHIQYIQRLFPPLWILQLLFRTCFWWRAFPCYLGLKTFSACLALSRWERSHGFQYALCPLFLKTSFFLIKALFQLRKFKLSFEHLSE